MIKEVDVDGDGRIDFYGKYLHTENVEYIYYFLDMRTLAESLSLKCSRNIYNNILYRVAQW